MVEMNSPLAVAYHEAGHAAMSYWRRESLDSRLIVLHADRFGGSTYVPVYGEGSETDLSVLIGGPMAEFLSMGIVPKVAIRFSSEYRDSNSDSTRMRAIVRKLCGGKDDKRYQFAVQERVREIIQEPLMWQGITALAEKLVAERQVKGEDAEAIFEGLGVLHMFNTEPVRLWAC